MQINSPSVKMVQQPGTENIVSRPVFGDYDRVEGRVMLDPTCSQNGRLTISVSLPSSSLHSPAERELD
jgi:hypothetical protein